MIILYNQVEDHSKEEDHESYSLYQKMQERKIHALRVPVFLFMYRFMNLTDDTSYFKIRLV